MKVLWNVIVVVSSVATVFFLSLVLNSIVPVLRQAGYDESFIEKNLLIATAFSFLSVAVILKGFLSSLLDLLGDSEQSSS